MRTIKFRGKRLDNGGWAYGNIINGHGIKIGVVYMMIYKPDTANKGELEMLDCDYTTVGQFTGLLDKNGKDIYEGDIVKCNRCTDPDEDVIVLIDDIMNIPNQLFGSFRNHRVVIGNIHDNPELLEQ